MGRFVVLNAGSSEHTKARLAASRHFDTIDLMKVDFHLGRFPATCRFVTVLLAVLVGNAGISRAEETGKTETAKPSFIFGGYAEAFYQWNFNRPANGLTNYRGFDNRHNSFTLSNVALDTSWEVADIVGKVTLQVGHTPSTYYLAEPNSPGSAGANSSGAELWKYIQQAYVGYRFGLGRGLLLQAGIFLSPIGPEAMAVRDDWNWSRSNLFFGLPYYHTGAKITYPFTDAWSVTVACYNGWNSVVDNNAEKSVAAQVTYTRPDKLALSLLYFGGVERPSGAPEGRPWRHLVDMHATWQINSRLSLLGHVNGGTELGRFGTSAWIASAFYVRVRAFSKLFFGLRGDVFREKVPSSPEGQAAAIFWPVPWVASGTGTIDFRPHERTSFRLEYRHDHAAGNMFFGGEVAGNGTTNPFIANRKAQDTVTLGATTWF